MPEATTHEKIRLEHKNNCGKTVFLCHSFWLFFRSLGSPWITTLDSFNSNYDMFSYPTPTQLSWYTANTPVIKTKHGC